MTQTRSPVLFVVGLVVLSTLAFAPAAAGAAPADGATYQVDDNETATDDGPTFDGGGGSPTDGPTTDGPTTDGNATGNVTGEPESTAETTGETVQVSNATVDALKNQTARIAYYIEGLKNRTAYQVELFQGLPQSVSATGDRISSLSDTPSAERNNTIDAIRSELDEQRKTILRYRTQTQWQLDAARAYLEKIEEINQTVKSIEDRTVQQALQKHLGFHTQEVKRLVENLETQVNASRTALETTIELDQGLGELRNQTAPKTPTPGGNDTDQGTPLFDEGDGGSGSPFADEVSVSDLKKLQDTRETAIQNISTKLDQQIDIVRNLDEYLAQQSDLVEKIDNGEVPDPSQIQPVSTATGNETAPVGGDGAGDGTPSTDGGTNETGGNESDDSGGAGAIGPGFAPLTALVAVALAIAIVLARRRQ